jgi:hypothetical protein
MKRLVKQFGAAAAAMAIVLAVAGTVSAVTVWATPDDHYASSPADGSNEHGFWEDRFDLNEGDCWKLTDNQLNAVMNSDGSASLGVAYDFVVVKQANPHAKNVTYDNTIFNDVAANETVFADTDGNGTYTDADSNGISHIIVCGPSVVTTTTTTDVVTTTTTDVVTTTTTDVVTTTTTDVVTTTTTTDTFSSETGGETDAPSEPNTATLGTSTGAPADGAWLLVIALGVLLASIVVMTPAKARR